MADENNNQEEQNQGDGGTPATWEAYLESLPEGVKGLYDVHVGGLKSALEAERMQSKDLAGQLREAMGKLDKGSDALASLEALSGKLEQATARADFFAEAARPEMGCTNPRLAWLTAQDVEAFDRRGNVDWKAVQEAAPELFGKSAPPPAHAGEGSGGNSPGGKQDMNTIIRGAVGL